MKRARRLALIAVVLGLILGGGWLGVRAVDAQATAAAKKEVAHLQALATSACRCAREKGEAGRNACWQDYNAAMADKDVTQTTVMCLWAPSEDCIPTYAGVECIVTEYGSDICTRDEARAIEAAYTAALNAEGEFLELDDAGQTRANKRANAAAENILRRLKAGEKVSAPAVQGGCAG